MIVEIAVNILKRIKTYTQLNPNQEKMIREDCNKISVSEMIQRLKNIGEEKNKRDREHLKALKNFDWSRRCSPKIK